MNLKSKCVYFPFEIDKVLFISDARYPLERCFVALILDPIICYISNKVRLPDLWNTMKLEIFDQKLQYVADECLYCFQRCQCIACLEGKSNHNRWA